MKGCGEFANRANPGGCCPSGQNRCWRKLFGEKNHRQVENNNAVLLGKPEN